MGGVGGRGEEGQWLGMAGWRGECGRWGGSPLVEDVGDGGVTRSYSHEEEEGKRLVGQKREGRVKMTTSYYMDTPINRWIYTCNWQLGIVWGCRIGDGVEYTQLTSEEICWLLVIG